MADLRKAGVVLLCGLLMAGCDRAGSEPAASSTSPPPAGSNAAVHGPAGCSASTRVVTARVDVQQVLVPSRSAQIFGFNVPWQEFQDPYIRKGEVRAEVLEALRPFAGALYRYPGGSPANWFEWRKAVGPLGSRRPQHYNFGQHAVASFGYPEFLRFARQVDGTALLTLNIAGEHQRPRDDAWAQDNVLGLMRWMASPDGAGCVGGDGCPVRYWELGNEVDIEPYHWSAERYAARAAAIVPAAAKEFPQAVWVAHGKSAPWDGEPAARRFNDELARLLPQQIRLSANHPYYDGIDIPTAKRYIDEINESWSRRRPGAAALVTEHARWPGMPLIGKWEDNWAEADNISGAISTADFQLAVMADPKVLATNLHTISAVGPWKLFRWDRRRDRIFASPLYWALRVLRDDLRRDVVAVQPALVPGRAYGGGYDMRLLAMSDGGANGTLLGVNRSSRPVRLDIDWQGFRPGEPGSMRWVSGQLSDDNTVGQEQRVMMQRWDGRLPAGRQRSAWCIPAHSVFAVHEL